MKSVAFFITLFIISLWPCSASFDEERNEHRSSGAVRGRSLADLDDYIVRRQALARDHVVKLSANFEMFDKDVEALMYGARIEISGSLYKVLSITVNTLSSAACSLRPSPRLSNVWSVFRGQRCCGRLVLKPSTQKRFVR